MKKTHTLIVPLLAASVALTGCATTGLAAMVPFQSQSTAGADKPATDKARVAKSAGIGCLAGGALAYLTGKKDKALTACAAGAVVGGVASYRKQLGEAEAAAEAARAAGLEAQVQTKTVEAEDGQTEALEALVIGYKPGDMQPVSARTASVLDRLALIVGGAKNEITVRFEGTDRDACQVPRAELTKRGALAKAKVEDRCGQGAHRIVVSPMPDLG